MMSQKGFLVLRLTALLLLLGWLKSLGAPAPVEDLPKPASRVTTNLCGWTVLVDERLIHGPAESLGSRAVKLLDSRLNDITYVLPPAPLQRLRSVRIVLDLTHGRLRSMQYHPSADWLQGNGYSPDLARCVHICEAADFTRARQINEQPWVILHELAHAYHDQVLGFEEPRIRTAFEAYRQSGSGNSVLRFDGHPVRHYALTDAKEFFAEFTEAYFGLNDFFPFNRAELRAAEPDIFALMKSVWDEAPSARAFESEDRSAPVTANSAGLAEPRLPNRINRRIEH